mgnify:CR=1 FL=1
MQVAKQPFLVSTLDLNGKKVLVQLEVAEKDKGKSVRLIGDPRVPDENKEALYRNVIVERTPDGGEMLKITIGSSNTRGRRRGSGTYYVHHGWSGLEAQMVWITRGHSAS